MNKIYENVIKVFFIIIIWKYIHVSENRNQAPTWSVGHMKNIINQKLDADIKKDKMSMLSTILTLCFSKQALNNLNKL